MPIPSKGSIPGRKSRGGSSSDAVLGNLLGGMGGLLGGLLKDLGKTIENVQNLNLEDLEKLAETQGNQEAKEKIKKLKEVLGEKGISNLFSEGIDLNRLIKFAAERGGEFSQEFGGGKGMVRGGLRGHILGIPLGGKDLPLERRGSQEAKFDVSVTRRKQASGTKKAAPREVDIQELEIDPIEEDEKSFTVRGYMAGVDEAAITCEVKENGNVLKISARGRKNYEKEVNLSSPVTEKVKWSYKNGVLEVILQKATSKGE